MPGRLSNVSSRAGPVLHDLGPAGHTHTGRDAGICGVPGPCFQGCSGRAEQGLPRAPITNPRPWLNTLSLVQHGGFQGYQVSELGLGLGLEPLTRQGAGWGR